MVPADKPKNDALSSGLRAPIEKSRAVEQESFSSVLVGDDGNTIIHHDVVAKIVGMAVADVDGVHELVPWGANQTVSAFAKRVVGKSMRDLGVNVEVGTIEAAADVRIVTVYGKSIVNIAADIRQNVRERIEGMTGLRVSEVNIEVIDLYFPETEQQEAPSTRAR